MRLALGRVQPPRLALCASCTRIIERSAGDGVDAVRAVPPVRQAGRAVCAAAHPQKRAGADAAHDAEGKGISVQSVLRKRMMGKRIGRGRVCTAA